MNPVHPSKTDYNTYTQSLMSTKTKANNHAAIRNIIILVCLHRFANLDIFAVTAIKESAAVITILMLMNIYKKVIILFQSNLVFGI